MWGYGSWRSRKSRKGKKMMTVVFFNGELSFCGKKKDVDAIMQSAFSAVFDNGKEYHVLHGNEKRIYKYVEIPMI